MYIMSDNEIAAAWLRVRKDLKQIDLEIAGLETELKQMGVSLKAAGDVFLKTPDMSWNIDAQSLSDALLAAEKQAKRYSDLLADRADKQAQIEKFEASA
jgi:hypothetical protein